MGIKTTSAAVSLLVLATGATASCARGEEAAPTESVLAPPCLTASIIDYNGEHPGYPTPTDSLAYFVSGATRELAVLKDRPDPTPRSVTYDEAVFKLNGSQALLDAVSAREQAGRRIKPLESIEVADRAGRTTAAGSFEQAADGGYRISQISLQHPNQADGTC